jgi:hypothetical protein
MPSSPPPRSAPPPIACSETAAMLGQLTQLQGAWTAPRRRVPG